LSSLERFSFSGRTLLHRVSYYKSSHLLCNPTPPPLHTVPATTDVFLTSRDLLFYNLVIPTSVLSQLFPSRDHLQIYGPPQCWKQKKTARQQIPLNESRSLYALSLHLNLCSDLPSDAHTRTHTQFLSPERRRFFCHCFAVFSGINV
jgi:hypothetical protein